MKLRVTVNGVDYDVDVEILEETGGLVSLPTRRPAPRPAVAAAPSRPPVAPAAPQPAAAVGSARTLNSPIPGTVVELKVTPGQAVAQNETVIIIDAMKMNTPVPSPQAGTVKEILVKAGDPVKMGQPLMTFE
jgi:biotin carboxyl carrier protein